MSNLDIVIDDVVCTQGVSFTGRVTWSATGDRGQGWGSSPMLAIIDLDFMALIDEREMMRIES